MAARILGSARELPFNVCARAGLPFSSLKRNLSLLGWNDSKFETEPGIKDLEKVKKIKTLLQDEL